MKMVIEIPNDFYKELMNGSDIEISCDGHFVVTDSWASDVIRNGKPLDSVLDEIRAEMLEYILPQANSNSTYILTNNHAIERAVAVIDKYKESEDKE